jgi:hypothetical protein
VTERTCAVEWKLKNDGDSESNREQGRTLGWLILTLAVRNCASGNNVPHVNIIDEAALVADGDAVFDGEDHLGVRHLKFLPVHGANGKWPETDAFHPDPQLFRVQALNLDQLSIHAKNIAANVGGTHFIPGLRIAPVGLSVLTEYGDAKQNSALGRRREHA